MLAKGEFSKLSRRFSGFRGPTIGYPVRRSQERYVNDYSSLPDSVRGTDRAQKTDMQFGYAFCVVAIGATGSLGFALLGERMSDNVADHSHAETGPTSHSGDASASSGGLTPTLGARSQAGVLSTFARNLQRLGSDATDFSRRMSEAADKAIDAHRAGDEQASTLAYIEMETIRSEVAVKAAERDGVSFEQIIRGNEMWGTTETNGRFSRDHMRTAVWDDFLDDVNAGHASLDALIEARQGRLVGDVEGFLAQHNAERRRVVANLVFGGASDSKLTRLFSELMPGVATRYTPSDAKADPLLARLRHDGPEQSVYIDFFGSPGPARELNQERFHRLKALHTQFEERLAREGVDLVVDLTPGANELTINRDRMSRFIDIGIDHPQLFEAVEQHIDIAKNL